MKQIILTLLLSLIITLTSFSQELKPFNDEDGRFGFKNENEKIIVPLKLNFSLFTDNYIEYKVGVNNEISFIIIGRNSDIIQSVKKIAEVDDVYEGITPSFITNEYFSKEGEFYVINSNGLSKPYSNIKVLQNASDDMEYGEKYFYKPIIESGLYNINPNVDSLDYYYINMYKINSKLRNKYLPYVALEKLPKELLFIVKENNKWGVINSKFEIILEHKYDKIDILQNNTFNVWQDGKNGIVDYTAKEIVPIKYNWFNYDLYDGARVVFNGKLVTKDGNLPEPVKGRYGMIDTSGNEIIPVKYDNYKEYLVYNEEKPLFTIFSNGSCPKEYIEKVEIVEEEYAPDEYRERTVYSLKNVYTKEGEFVIFANNKLSNTYENIKVLEPLSENNLYGENYFVYKKIVEDTLNQLLESEFDIYILTSENTTIYETTTEFDGDKLTALNAKISGINKVNIFNHNNIPELLYIVKKNNKWGVINSNLEIVIPIKYNDINSFTHNNKFCFIVNNGEQDIYITTKGEIIK